MRTSWAALTTLALASVCLGEPPKDAGTASPPPAAVTDGPPVDVSGVRYLWPRFEKGQRVILRRTHERGEHGGREVTMRVTIDVIDRVNDEFVLLWKVDQVETTTPGAEGMKEFVARELRRFQTPVLELVVKEGVGLVGVRNWEKAAAEEVAMLDREFAPVMQDDRSRQGLEKVKAMLSDRKRAESILLETVRWYFEGAYLPLTPGASATDEVSEPVPFFPGDPVMVKCERKRECDGTGAVASPLRTLSTQLTFDSADLKAAFSSMLGSLNTTTGAEKERPPIESCDAKIVHQWTLDPNRGWPSAAVCSTEQTVNGRTNRRKIRWELIEGPMPMPAESEPNNRK